MFLFESFDKIYLLIFASQGISSGLNNYLTVTELNANVPDTFNIHYLCDK